MYSKKEGCKALSSTPYSPYISDLKVTVCVFNSKVKFVLSCIGYLACSMSKTHQNKSVK